MDARDFLKSVDEAYASELISPGLRNIITKEVRPNMWPKYAILQVPKPTHGQYKAPNILLWYTIEDGGKVRELWGTREEAEAVKEDRRFFWQFVIEIPDVDFFKGLKEQVEHIGTTGDEQ